MLAVSNPFLIHVTPFLSYPTAFSFQLFCNSGFLSQFRGQIFLNYFKNVNKSRDIFLWVLWELIFRVNFSSGLPRSHILSFALDNFFMCPTWLFSLPWMQTLSRLRVCQQTVWYANLPANSSFCVGFPVVVWFSAEVSTSYLFFLVLLYLNQWRTWQTGISSMHFCRGLPISAPKLVLYSRDYISQILQCYCTHVCIHTHTLHAEMIFEIFSFCIDVESR